MRMRGMAIGLGLFAACAYGAPPAAPPADAIVDSMFQCGTARVDAMVEEDGLVLTVDTATYALKPVPSASGAKYEGDMPNGKVTFWSKGRDAVLKLGNKNEVKCTQLADDEVDSDEVDD